MDNDLLERTVREIYMPQAILAMAPKPNMPIGSENLESVSDSYSFWLGRALFDSVYDEVSIPLVDFAISMISFVPYREDVAIPMLGYDHEEWEDVLDGVLLERKRIEELIRGKKKNYQGDVAVARIKGRDYLLEVMIRGVEKNTREQKALEAMRAFDEGAGLGYN
tara:strand:+ start:201 stop:695 length:495 start_codon:yes stop_codon:yes gene_type:complete